MDKILQFYIVNSDTFDNTPIGTVTIDDSDKISSTDSNLLALVESSGADAKAILARFSDWSNGYLTSELVKTSKELTASISLVPLEGCRESFYNHNHGKGGLFTSGPGSTAGVAKIIRKADANDENASENVNGSQVKGHIGEPPHGHFTPEIEKAIRDVGHKPEDYDQAGKPIPGTDSWRDAHGISKKIYETRPMARWSSSKDPIFEKVFPDPKDRRFARVTVASQSTGFVMVRKGAPGAEEEFGPIAAQARPDHPIVVNQQRKYKKEQELKWALERLKSVNSENYTAADAIKERETRVNRSKQELRQLQTQTPQEIRYNAEQAKIKAQVKLKKAERSGDTEKIGLAAAEVKTADFQARNEKKKAALLESDPQRAVEIVKQDIRRAEKSLEWAKANPEKALENNRTYAADQVEAKTSQLDKVAVKYVFPKGQGKAARIEVHQDKDNIKNLVDRKSRVYFIMEGNIKADAALTQVKKEDPTAAVMSVPSVTSWPKEETDWYGQKYLKGRDIVLIPDADGVTNVAVVAQAKQLAGKLRTNGVNNVIIASPPLVKDEKGKLKVEDLYHPTGVRDERKGLDDHLGLGKGTLGDLTFDDAPPPKFDLSSYATPNTPKGTRIRSQAVKNSQLVLNAISDLAGYRGAVKVSDKAIEKYTGLRSSSVNDAKTHLERMQIIKVNNIFDPQRLGDGRRVPIMEYDEIKRLSKKAGSKVPNLDLKYVDNDDNHEVAPIIEVINPKYVTPSGQTKKLASVYDNLKTSSHLRASGFPSGIIRLHG